MLLTLSHCGDICIDIYSKINKNVQTRLCEKMQLNIFNFRYIHNFPLYFLMNLELYYISKIKYQQGDDKMKKKSALTAKKNKELTKENFIEHSCTDERMMNWVLKNLSEESFEMHHSNKYFGFGCTCRGYNQETDKYVCGQYELYSEYDDAWEDWMFELNEREIRIYFCPFCKQWTIDTEL